MITIKRSDEYHEYAAVVILLFDKPTSRTWKPSIKFIPGLSFFSLLLWLISSVRQIFAPKLISHEDVARHFEKIFTRSRTKVESRSFVG